MDELKSYQRRILLGYTVAGVVTSLALLYATTTDVLQEIPLPEALVFLAVMVMPMCVGNIIARDVSSPDQSWSPFAHWKALRTEAPVVLATVASIVAIDVALYAAQLPSFLMALPPIVGGWFLEGRLRNP